MQDLYHQQHTYKARNSPDTLRRGRVEAVSPTGLRALKHVARFSSFLPLGLQIAQSRYYLQTLDPKVGTICILGVLGFLHASMSMASERNASVSTSTSRLWGTSTQMGILWYIRMGSLVVLFWDYLIGF